MTGDWRTTDGSPRQRNERDADAEEEECSIYRLLSAEGEAALRLDWEITERSGRGFSVGMCQIRRCMRTCKHQYELNYQRVECVPRVKAHKAIGRCATKSPSLLQHTYL
jgi:hypothetical protein